MTEDPNLSSAPHPVDKLISTVHSYFPDAQTDILKTAYDFAARAHEGQNRSSGDPYIIHPLDVAIILAQLRLDVASLVTALLHDTVEDTGVTLADVEKTFGKEIAELVDGVTKLSKITFKTSEEKQAENFRKMIVAMARDIRVILVKIADRLNNMRTLEHLPEPKQKLIAQETLDIYAPIANRLGLGWIKIELEDWCLRFLHPDVYYKLSKSIARRKKEREALIEKLIEDILEGLKEYDVRATVQGRAKHFYSIYRKMVDRGVDFEQVNDLIAFRILVENITECYKALGIIHAAYKPLPGRFKDYIAMPKGNGYQSLHTTVMAFEGERVEIQIRTHEMHEVAERGIAAHWKYKEGKFSQKNSENISWVNRLVEWHKDLSDPSEFLETVKIDLFAEDVFVFTPTGEVRQLTYGSSPLDFAYAIHTDVGNRCVGAKVNGRMVPLKHRLKSGDIIEILTSPNQNPSKDWLKIVKSSRAKAKIRSFIKTHERERAKKLGEEMLDKALRLYESSLNKLEKSGDLQKGAQSLNYKGIEELLAAVGYGRLQIPTVLPHLVPKEKLLNIPYDLQISQPEKPSFMKKVFGSAQRRSEARNAVIVDDLEDILVRFARCCNPVPGDNIVGFISLGRGVTIHSVNCHKALEADQPRRVNVIWNPATKHSTKRQVKMRILCVDEVGILALLSQTITNCGVNIVSANIRTTRDRKAVAIFDIDVTDTVQLQRVTSALEAKKGVLAVERVKA